MPINSDLKVRQEILLLSIRVMAVNDIPLDPLSVQKMAFLVTKLLPDKLEDYDRDYIPFDLGPYSELVETDIVRMQDLSLLPGNLENKAAFKSEAARAIEKIETTDKSIQEVVNLIASFKGFSRDDLVYTVYNLYPEYASGSKIRSRVKSRRLESISIDMGDLSNQKGMEIVTDKGRKVRVELVDGKIIFKEVERA